MALTRVAPAGIGSTPGTGYVIGDSFLHSRGLNSIDANYTGIVTTQSLRVIGDLQVDGTTTTLDTVLTEVDKLEVGANNNTVGVAITQSGSGDILNLYDGSTEVFTVTDGGKVGIEAPNPSGNLNISYLQVGKGQVSSDHSLYNYNTSFTNNAYQNGNGTFAHITNRAVGVINIQDNVFKFLNGPGGTAGQSATLTERFTISSNGKVGINSTTPGHKLEVAYTSDDDGFVINHANRGGKWRFATSGSNAELFDIRRYDGANSTFRRYLLFGPDQFSVYTGSTTSATERLRITSAGSVGIGTASPEEELHIFLNSSSDGPGLRLTNPNGGDGTYIGRISTGDAAGTFFAGINFLKHDSNDGEIRLRTKVAGSNTDVVTIVDGSVGIGINNPTSLLHAQNNSATDTKIIIESTGTNSYPTLRIINDARSYDLGIDGATDAFRVYDVTGSAERLRITTTGSMGLGCIPETDFQVRNGNGGTIKIGGSGNDATGLTFSYNNSGTTTTTIKQHYRATSGSALLHVDTGTLTIATGTSNTEKLRIGSDGKVLIGSDTGSVHGDRLLQVGKTDRNSTYVSITCSTSGVGGLLFADTTTNDTGGYRGIIDYTHSSDAMRFYTQAIERLRIRSDGKLMTQSAGYVYTASSAGSLSLYGGNTNLGGGIVLGGGNSNADIRFLAQASTSSPAERLRIDANGRILVGPGAIANPKVTTVGAIDTSNSDWSIVMGGSGSGNRANGAIKDGRFAGAHYTNAEEPIGLVRSYSTSSANEVHIGGGSSLVNAATQLSFYTATNTTTTGGTERLRINSAGDVGIGEDGPTARLHVRSTGITAGAPSEGWPDWNADNDNNAKIVALLETGGNGDVGATGHGASVVLRMGQYYDSRAIISPTPGGGASPSDQGVGHGKDLMVKGGRSDNNNGRNGGRLFLDGGGGFNSGSFGNLIGDVILQSQGGYIGLNGQTNPEYPFDLIDGNNRAYFTQGSDSTMSLVMYDNSNYRTSIQAYGGQLRLNVMPTSGGSLEPCMKFNTEGDAIIGRGYNDDPTSNRRLVVKDTNSIIRIESPGSSSGDYCQMEFKTGGTTAWIWKNPTSNTGYGGADSLNFYNSSNASISFFTNGNNERLRITGSGDLQVGSNTMNFYKNEYRGSVSVTGTNNESFAFEIQGSSYASGGLLYVYGTSGNVVVNVSAEILVNHSQDVTVRSMSGAYTQARIRVKSDSNARAAIYLGRNAGYGSGTTSLNWKFIPFGGTYAYTTESTNNGTDHTHTTVSGSFNLTAAGGGAGNVNASGSKNFLINHPLESLRETTRLAHAAVEGPECNTIYRGKVDLVDGTATVNIDTNSRMTEGTFVALNQNVQCFTTNETGWTAIKGSVSGNLLTITAQDNTCTDTISWMVVGERHDQDIIDNRATDSEGRFIPEVTDEYNALQFADYTDPVEPEPELDNTEERDPTV